MFHPSLVLTWVRIPSLKLKLTPQIPRMNLKQSEKRSKIENIQEGQQLNLNPIKPLQVYFKKQETYFWTSTISWIRSRNRYCILSKIERTIMLKHNSHWWYKRTPYKSVYRWLINQESENISTKSRSLKDLLSRDLS